MRIEEVIKIDRARFENATTASLNPKLLEEKKPLHNGLGN